MTVREAYDKWSETYDNDRNRTRDLDGEVTRKLLGSIRFDRVLEIGCGTGKNTVFFSEISKSVLAMDFSEAMLEKARWKEYPGEVTFARADITQPWQIAENTFDLISCNLVLEHVADLPFVFSEAARGLKPPGRFFISELHPFRQYQGTQANFQHPDETVVIPAFLHHISEFLKAAAQAGFTLIDLQEWWHKEDRGKPPRLVTFLFEA